MREEFPQEEKVPSLKEARTQLRALAAFGYELQDLREESFIARREKRSPDPTAADRVRTITQQVEPRMAFLRAALQNDSLTADALHACYSLISTNEFELQIAERIADAASNLRTFLARYPRETGLAVQLMCEAHASIKHNTENPKTLRNAKKIETVIARSADDLALFFSDANSPRPEEIRNRLWTLQQIASIDPSETSQWALIAMGMHIARLVPTDLYIAELDSATEVKQMFSKKPRHVLPERQKGTVTRSDIETILALLGPQQRASVLSAALLSFGLPGPLYVHHGERMRSLGSDDDWSQRYILDQLGAIQGLESKYPGSANSLHNEFGIRWFSRYPTKVLLSQFEERNAQKPYGIFVSAHDDHNGGFFSENDRVVVQSIARQVRRYGLALRIIESADKHFLEKRLFQLDQKYGGDHKISFMFIRAHSDRERLELGPDEEAGDLGVSDLGPQRLGKARTVFKENPTIIFDGCSVGRRGGVAEATSQAFDATVLAPKGVQSALTKVTISKTDNGLRFDPRYETDKTGSEVPPHIYIGGRKR